MKRLLLLILIFLNCLVSNAQWIQCNGPYGGDITSFGQNKITNTIFAGSSNNGLYRYRPNIGHWENLINVLPAAWIREIAVLDSDVFVTTLYDDLFRSHDNGNTWEKTIIDTSTFLYSFYTDNVLTNDSLVIVTKYAKAYKSKDLGVTFTEIPPSIPDSTNYIIDIIQLGNRLFTLSSPLSTGNNIHYTDDMGQNWHIPSASIPKYGSWEGFRIFGKNIYAFGYPKIYVSSDSGNIWKDITPNDITKGTTFNDIYISGDTVLLATASKGTYLSIDSGITFKKSYIGLPFQDIVSRKFLNTYDKGLILATTSGIFNTRNFGLSWNDFNNNIATSNIYNISECNNRIFVGTEIQGVFSSIDNGYSWQRKSNGLDSFNQYPRIFDIISVGSRVILGTDYYKVYYSDNNGNTWIHSTKGLNTNEIFHFKYVQGKLYACTGVGIFYSTDLAITWEKITNGPTCMIIALFIDDSIIIAENHCSKPPPYDKTEIQRSVDYGKSFSKVISPYILVDIEKIGKVIMAADQTAFLLKSFDNGLSWNIDSSIGKVRITDIYIDDSKYVFIGTESGRIYFSNDSGTSWLDITNNFKGIATNFLKYGNNLFISTINSGVWKRDITSINGYHNNTGTIGNFLIYPNPNSGTFIITAKYSINSIDIINLTGKVLYSNYNINGQKITEIDLSYLPKGIYFARIQDGKQVMTKKIIIQ